VKSKRQNQIIMLIPYLKYFINSCKGNRGFSLVELMVVMVIVGILATSVVFTFADPTAKVKAAAFEMRGDFNLARAEAVSRNDNILIDFIDSAKETCSKETAALFADCFAGGSFQGYVICFDEDTGNDCSDEGASAADLEEKVIKTVLFRDSIRYYKFGATLPTSPNGPQAAPVIPPDPAVSLANNDGITFAAGSYLSMNSNGTSSDIGSVVIYLPKGGAPLTTVRGRPFAIVVDSTSTGRVRLERWRPEMGVSGTWFRR
jgi:prepilin-type N-terminal cleavage/methylation domain-containing protein